MMTSNPQNVLRPGSAASEGGARSPPSSPSSQQDEPRAIALDSDSAAKTDGQYDPILINVASGDRARWSTAKSENTSHLTNSTGDTRKEGSLPKITKQCLPRGGTYLSTIIGPIQVSSSGRSLCARLVGGCFFHSEMPASY